MANVTVQKVEDNKPVPTPLLEEMSATFDKIRRKAFEIFERRGGMPGKEIEDWIEAEHDLFWVPQAEFVETEAEFRIKVAVPGFEPKDLVITAQPGEILIRGNAEKREEKKEGDVFRSEFGEKSLYRRFALKTSIEIGAVNANVDKGMLTVIVPKKREDKRKSAAA